MTLSRDGARLVTASPDRKLRCYRMPGRSLDFVFSEDPLVGLGREVSASLLPRTQTIPLSRRGLLRRKGILPRHIWE